ncbi:MAG: YchF-related putative GTPase [Thermoplasmataceae archaeon]|jgi:small GTP-binding protein
MSRIKIGLVGKPNVGKSTLFSAITSNAAEIGNYPFTTLKPNTGVGLITTTCPEVELGKKCNPREGTCEGGIRKVPIEVIDVPGLIEGASSGKGMGNEFLENIKDADALLLVFDASGRTTMEGVPSESTIDPAREIEMVRSELYRWLSSRLSRDWERFAKKEDSSGEKIVKGLLKKTSSLGIGEKDVSRVLNSGVFPAKLTLWGESDFDDFARKVFEIVKPIVPVGNKVDAASDDTITRLRSLYPEIMFTSGGQELAISKAIENGIVEGRSIPFRVSSKANEAQRKGLAMVETVMRKEYYSSPQQILTKVVLSKLGLIFVYPVYDESHWTDKEGNVLPDCFLVPKGTTAIDLAFKVHTEIGNGFIKAIDCRKKRIIARDHELQDSDVISIVSKS